MSSSSTDVSREGTKVDASDAEMALNQKAPPPMTFPDGGAQAWMVALGAGGVLFCTFGYVNAFGIYQDYYITHQLSHRSASDISWIGSMQTFFLFAAGLVGGPLFDRYGGKVIWVPSFILVFSVMMTSLCKEYYQFFLAQGVLGGIGMGLSMAPALSSTAQYFQKKRAAAIGITVAGSSLGGVIFPIALQRMFNSHLGFPWGVRVVGFIMLAVLGFAVVAIRARLPPRKREFFKPSAFKSKKYVGTIITVFLLDLGLFTPFFYLPLYGEQHGMSSRMSFYLVSILNASSFFGRVIPGILADKFGTLNMLSFLSLVAGILTFCWDKMTNNATIIVFAVLYGFFSGGMISLTPAAIANVPENPQDIGTYMGMGTAVISIATLIGPPINGALINHYGGWLQVQIFSGVVILAGSVFGIVTKLLSGKGLLEKA
ncbi:major facilitator superfamily domain-containing protein [Aspergillus avenaceus]|uniref:Major facilitator superfamily domain-containing protein n=1 Tax=Aspergillus avenaceus TaxID=36643 RepID=A0A5N6U5G4_ASPAV|nr:major facilitator superfamily domain-containing protein [Aspergillus avenaceus]